MRYEISVTPNRTRGYDAAVLIGRNVRLSAYLCRDGKTSAFDVEATVASFNAPSESAARAQAEAWVAANPMKRAKRAARPMSEGELESREAARNERDYL